MKNFLNQAKSFIDRLNPKYFLPFAGSYILSGHLSSLQDLRGVPNIDFASEYLEKNIVSNYFADIDIIIKELKKLESRPF